MLLVVHLFQDLAERIGPSRICCSYDRGEWARRQQMNITAFKASVGKGHTVAFAYIHWSFAQACCQGWE